MLDFRAALEGLLMNSRQRGGQEYRVQLVVTRESTSTDIFTAFGQLDFLHAYLLAQLGGNKLYIRTEDKIPVPIAIQIIEYRRRSRRVLGVPYNNRTVVDTPRDLFIGSESSREEQRVPKRNSGYTILVV